jgi:lipoprotein signal peptidase
MIYFALVGALVVLDRLTKYLCFHFYPGAVTGFGIIHAVEHPDHMYGQWAVDLMNNAIWIAAVCFTLKKFELVNQSRMAIIAFALYISGGFGNSLDKIFLSGATDFIRVPLGIVTVDTNLADIYMFIAFGLMLYEVLRSTKEQPRFKDE